MSRRAVVKTGVAAAWAAPVVVAVSATPAYAVSQPQVPPVWSVSTPQAFVSETVPGSGSYFFEFDVNVLEGSLGALMMEWVAPPSRYIGGPGQEFGFINWFGHGVGNVDKNDPAQQDRWLFTADLNPVEGPILMNVVGEFQGISAMDLPLTVSFNADSDGSAYYFDIISGGEGQLLVLPQHAGGGE